MTSFESHRLYDFMVCHLDHYPGLISFVFFPCPVSVIPPTGLFPIAYISYVDFLCLIPSTQTVKHWGGWINPFDGRTHAAFQIYYLPPRVHDLHEHPGRVQINSSDVKLRKKAKIIKESLVKEREKKKRQRFDCEFYRNGKQFQLFLLHAKLKFDSSSHFLGMFKIEERR